MVYARPDHARRVGGGHAAAAGGARAWEHGVSTPRCMCVYVEHMCTRTI